VTLPGLLQLQEIPDGFLQWAGHVDRSELLGVSRIPDLQRIAEVSLYTELCISRLLVQPVFGSSTFCWCSTNC